MPLLKTIVSAGFILFVVLLAIGSMICICINDKINHEGLEQSENPWKYCDNNCDKCDECDWCKVGDEKNM